MDGHLYIYTYSCYWDFEWLILTGPTWNNTKSQRYRT
jgi:hypothetical protein